VRWLLCFILVVQAAVARGEVAATSSSEFPFEYREGLLWVGVAIPQSEKPLNFLLDTGAGVSVINLNTAKRIGLRLGQRVTVHGVETMLTGNWQQRMSASVGNVRLPSEYLAIDLGKLSSSCERPVDGLIGTDFFRGRVVQIDFDAQKIRLLKSDKSEKSGDALPLQLRSCGMRVPIAVNGHERQWVRLDTGCATALQWVTSDVPDQCTHQMAIGLAEISIPQTKTSVTIGKHEFENVPTGLHEKAIFPGETGLLGNGLISRFSSVTIDAKAGRLILEKHLSAQ
jgi:Aspartyl protease